MQIDPSPPSSPGPHPGVSSAALVRVRRMGIDTYQTPVIYLHQACGVCRSEGFESQSRVEVRAHGVSVIATLNVVSTTMLADDEAGLSESAWRMLGVEEGDAAELRHPDTLDSLRWLRAKVYGQELAPHQLRSIVWDIAAGRYSELELAAFITACAGSRMTLTETVALTRAMVEAGQVLKWPQPIVVDKHSIGGIPGNRTTPIVVSIVAAQGLCIPKTSSRAITSPAGTADTMETLTFVDLDLARMRAVVEREGGCLVWGGSVTLSPADDALIRVERPLDLDSEAQMVASVLSKKIAAGATRVLIDIPVGSTAKVRSAEAAKALSSRFVEVGAACGIEVRPFITDGSQPIGRGVGPALEAIDVLAVLEGKASAPADLRERAIALAAQLLELGGRCAVGAGVLLARQSLADGSALRKFVAICEAQGGLKQPTRSRFRQLVHAPCAGRIASIDNRELARLAKMAGAPRAPEAGVEVLTHVGESVQRGQPTLAIHTKTAGELAYALDYLTNHPQILCVEKTQ